jgi:alkylation response protein AidB-like acyl-CoA dehydrogenase
MIPGAEQALIRDTARSFAAARLRPSAAERDRTGKFPADAVAEMGKLGFLGMLVPEHYDGAGADHVSYALAMEEVAAGDGACSTIMGVHNSTGCVPILRFGTEEQKQRFLRPMARGEQLAAFCLTEPEAGSEASAIRTRAQKRGNRYVLNGTKQFITGGANADLALVFAVTDPAAGKKGISAFIVPTDTAGYKVAKLETKLGQRASDTAQIVFDEVELTPDLMLGEEGAGYRIALANLEGGRIGIAGAIDRHGARGLRSGARLCQGAHSLRHRYHQPPGGGVPPGGHGDPDRGRAADDAARGSAPGRGPALHQGGLDGEALRLGDGGARVLRRDPDTRRIRLSRGLPGGAHLPRRARDPDL